MIGAHAFPCSPCGRRARRPSRAPRRARVGRPDLRGTGRGRLRRGARRSCDGVSATAGRLRDARERALARRVFPADRDPGRPRFLRADRRHRFSDVLGQAPVRGRPDLRGVGRRGELRGHQLGRGRRAADGAPREWRAGGGRRRGASCRSSGGADVARLRDDRRARRRRAASAAPSPRTLAILRSRGRCPRSSRSSMRSTIRSRRTNSPRGARRSRPDTTTGSGSTTPAKIK